jgi:hypothetical protein
MRILTDAGVVDVTVRDDATATLIGKYWNAVQRFLRTGDEEAVAGFGAIHVAGYPLLTDFDLIEYYARLGELDVDGIYASDERSDRQ